MDHGTHVSFVYLDVEQCTAFVISLILNPSPEAPLLCMLFFFPSLTYLTDLSGAFD